MRKRNRFSHEVGYLMTYIGEALLSLPPPVPSLRHHEAVRNTVPIDLESEFYCFGLESRVVHRRMWLLADFQRRSGLVVLQRQLSWLPQRSEYSRLPTVRPSML